MNIIITIIIGLVAGFLGSKIVKGKGSGVPVNIIIGIIGSFVGHFLLGLIGFASYGILADIVSATIGSVVLLWLLALITK